MIYDYIVLNLLCITFCDLPRARRAKIETIYKLVFRRRFRSVERQAAGRGVALRDLDFATLDELWDVAKAEETAARQMAGGAEERNG